MDEGSESIWNIDGAQFYTLFQFKNRFAEAMWSGDLDKAYWAVRFLRMEIDAKLKRKEEHKLLAELEEEKAQRKNQKVVIEKDTVDGLMRQVDEERTIFLQDRNNADKRARFYLVLEEFYMYICHIMKKHKMYYREGDDQRLAILRR